MFDLARTTSRSVPRRRLAAAAAVSAALMAVAVPGTGHAQEGGNDQVTLCHQTGDGTYETITVSESGAENGHETHDGDIIPAPADGCPTGSPPPGPAGETPPDQTPSGNTPAAPGKVLVCHLTASGDYTVIDIAEAGWENGHSQHEGDILLLGDAGTESCTDAQATLDAVAGGTAGVPGVDVDSLVPALPASASQDGLVTICHMTRADGYVKITIAEAGWDNGHSTHEGDIMLTGASASAACTDAEAALGSAAAGTPGVGGIDAESLVAADPDLPNTGVAHTVMLTVAAMALLSGLWMVRVSKVRFPS